MEQTDSPLPKHPPTRTTSRSTLVVWWAIVQLLWWWRGGIASLSLKECRQRSDLSNKGGTYVEESHMVLPQRERVWLFQSGGQKTAEQQQPQRGRRERVDGEERWGSWFEHPHMHCTHKSKHLGSLLASPLLLPSPHPPHPPIPPTPPPSPCRQVLLVMCSDSGKREVGWGIHHCKCFVRQSGNSCFHYVQHWASWPLLRIWSRADGWRDSGETLSSSLLAHPHTFHGRTFWGEKKIRAQIRSGKYG